MEGWGGGIYGALDLECFGVGDIVGGKLDGAGRKCCEKGLGERELRHSERGQAGCFERYQLSILFICA